MGRDSYSEKLKDPRWQKKRLEILQRDEFACRHCNSTENTLHVHHVNYERGKELWDYDDSNFLSLCEHCHQRLESAIKVARDILANGVRGLELYGEIATVYRFGENEDWLALISAASAFAYKSFDIAYKESEEKSGKECPQELSEKAS